MAIYSSNRIASIAAIDESEEVIKNDEITLENDSPSNETVEEGASIIETSTKDSTIEEETKEDIFSTVEKDDSYFGLKESSINIQENNLNMFNTLLEFDFLDVCKEQTLNESVSEAENKAKIDGIIDNINKIVECTSNSIKQTGLRLLEAYESIDQFNIRLQEKYSNSINEEAMVGFSGIKNFSFPNIDTDAVAESIANITNISLILDEAKSEVFNAEARNSVASAASKFNENLVSIRSELTDAIDAAIVNNENWIPDNNDLDFIKNINTKTVKAALESTISDIVESLNSFSNMEESDDIVKYNTVYEMVSEASKLVLEKFNIYKDLFIREVCNTRKALIVCGKYATNKSINEVSTFALTESSDMYVKETFENILNEGKVKEFASKNKKAIIGTAVGGVVGGVVGHHFDKKDRKKKEQEEANKKEGGNDK